MELQFGKQFIADLYLCQNEIWYSPSEFSAQISSILGLEKQLDLKWVYTFEPRYIRIYGDLDECLLLIQIFPDQRYIAIDLFAWRPEIDIQHWSEGVINIFAPQVVASECRPRAEHLVER